MIHAKKSAGILLYRRHIYGPEVLLVHPGGPFFKNKDLGTWSIPKGEFSGDESARDAAVREFKEELGVSLTGEMVELAPVIQKGGKTVIAFAMEGDVDPDAIVCNSFKMEWPPKSGHMKEFPEIDKGEWFAPDIARVKINPAQIDFIDQLIGRLKIQDSRSARIYRRLLS